VKRSRYQNGCLRLEPRKNGPDSWVFYWREQGRLRKKVVGSKQEFRTESEALKHIEPLRLRINKDVAGWRSKNACVTFRYHVSIAGSCK
jgi:hypothetical protein